MTVQTDSVGHLAHGLTVSIVNYNTWERTIECAVSVDGSLKELGLQFEVLIVDNGEPASAEQLAQLPSTSRVNSQHNNVGFGGGHNLNLRDSAMDTFLILNPDTTVNVAAIRKLYDRLRPTEGIVATAPRLRYPNGDPQGSMRRFPNLFTEVGRVFGLDNVAGSPVSTILHEPPINVDWWVDQPAGAAIMASTAILRAIGGFDEAFPMYFEDVDLCRRLRRQGRILVPANCSILHDGEGTAKEYRERSVFWIENSRARYIKKHVTTQPLRAAMLACSMSSGLTHLVGTEFVAVVAPGRRSALRSKARGYRLALASRLSGSDSVWRNRMM